MEIELAKTVAARPTDAFAVVADIVDWPQIIGSIKDIEVLTQAAAGRHAAARARDHVWS